MGKRSLVSLGLLILPVAVTIGTLFGVETVRHNRGEQSIFAPPSNSGNEPGGSSGAGSGSKHDDLLTTESFCQLSLGYSPDPGRYTYNPNQWGVTSGPGNLCMNVTVFDNGTYPTNATAPAFTATWQYPQGPETQPVHAFPNALVNFTKTIEAPTVELGNLSALTVDVIWTYGGGDSISPSNDPAALDAAGLNANVCIDMFMDSDSTKAQNTSTSSVEVMVWFGQYGLSTQPIGYLDGPKTTETVNTTVFSLYSGDNTSTNQKVFTWLAQGNATNFEGDINLLIQKLASYGGPTTTDYLGYVAFGSEALYSTTNVTFSVQELAIDFATGATA